MIRKKGTNHLIILCDNKNIENHPYLIGFNKFSFENNAVIPRNIVLTFLLYSLLVLFDALIIPMAFGSVIALNPASTVYRTERKSGAKPSLKDFTNAVLCA